MLLQPAPREMPFPLLVTCFSLGPCSAAGDANRSSVVEEDAVSEQSLWDTDANEALA